MQKCSYSSGWGSQADGVLLVMAVHLFVRPEIGLLPRSLILFYSSTEMPTLACYGGWVRVSSGDLLWVMEQLFPNRSKPAKHRIYLHYGS